MLKGASASDSQQFLEHAESVLFKLLEFIDKKYITFDEMLLLMERKHAPSPKK